jgi:hypothetical protein
MIKIKGCYAINKLIKFRFLTFDSLSVLLLGISCVVVVKVLEYFFCIESESIYSTQPATTCSVEQYLCFSAGFYIYIYIYIYKF